MEAIKKYRSSNWVKGQSGNPSGRTPYLQPELRKAINSNRSAFKNLVLNYLNLSRLQIEARQRDLSIPSVEAMLGQIIERVIVDGDMIKFKTLLELVFGKLPEEEEPFELENEEKMMVLAYRKRLEDEQRSLALSASEPAGSLESEDATK